MRPGAADPTDPARRAAVGGVLATLLLIGLVSARPRAGGASPLSPDVARLRLNPNTASREELMLLPDVGPAMADRIVAYRGLFAPGEAFRSLEDLDRIRLIGPATLEKLAPYLTFEAP